MMLGRARPDSDATGGARPGALERHTLDLGAGA